MVGKRRGPKQVTSARRKEKYTTPRSLTPLQRQVYLLRNADPTPTYEEVGNRVVEMGLATSNDRRFIENAYMRAATKVEQLRAFGVSEEVIFREKEKHDRNRQAGAAGTDQGSKPGSSAE